MRIGVPGMHHRRWRGLAQEELYEEMILAKELLQTFLRREVNSAACPFGRYGRQVLGYLRAAGFTRVYTSDRGHTRTESWLQPRNAGLSADTLEALQRLVDLREPFVCRLLRGVKATVKRVR